MFDKDIKILIVDDMNMFRQMVRQALSALGFKNMTEATDGTFAFDDLNNAAMTGVPYKLVISDWNMPKMKGITLLRKVRAEEWGKTLPFIMLTAEAEAQNIQEAILAGVDNYMIKPFSVDQLKTKLTQTYTKVTRATAKAS